MIDTHCHLTYDGLHEQIDAVVTRAEAAGVDRFISVGTTPRDSAAAIALTERFRGRVFATAGVHPHYSAEVGDDNKWLADLRTLTLNPTVVALGEMGLDRHYPEPPMELQERVFAAQLTLMTQGHWNGPAVIHNREATPDTLRMIREAGLPGDRFVFHCFTGSPAEIDAILEFGAMVSFTGIVTFASAPHVAEASDRVPLDRLMVETDSPYLTPAPHRKVRPNEPRFVARVAEFLANRRGLPLDEFIQAVDHNAERFFRLPGSAQ